MYCICAVFSYFIFVVSLPGMPYFFIYFFMFCFLFCFYVILFLGRLIIFWALFTITPHKCNILIFPVVNLAWPLLQ